MKQNSETLRKVVHIDEGRILVHLGELVRGTVEETLNDPLEAEVDALTVPNATHAVRIASITGPAVLNASYPGKSGHG